MANKEVISSNLGLVLERGKAPDVGIGFVILRVDPSRNGENSRYPVIWTVEELRDKPSTGRRKGQISIPLETREPGELHIGAVKRGLLEEFARREDLPRFANHLFFAMRDKGIQLAVDGGSRLLCDADIVIYDGLRTDIPIPSSLNEVKPHGWMPLFGKDGVLELPNLRPIARQVLDQVVRSKSIVQALANYEKARQITGGRPIFLGRQLT